MCSDLLVRVHVASWKRTALGREHHCPGADERRQHALTLSVQLVGDECIETVGKDDRRMGHQGLEVPDGLHRPGQFVCTTTSPRQAFANEHERDAVPSRRDAEVPIYVVSPVSHIYMCVTVGAAARATTVRRPRGTVVFDNYQLPPTLIAIV